MGYVVNAGSIVGILLEYIHTSTLRAANGRIDGGGSGCGCGNIVVVRPAEISDKALCTQTLRELHARMEYIHDDPMGDNFLIRLGCSCRGGEGKAEGVGGVSSDTDVAGDDGSHVAATGDASSADLAGGENATIVANVPGATCTSSCLNDYASCNTPRQAQVYIVGFGRSRWIGDLEKEQQEAAKAKDLKSLFYC